MIIGLMEKGNHVTTSHVRRLVQTFPQYFTYQGTYFRVRAVMVRRGSRSSISIYGSSDSTDAAFGCKGSLGNVSNGNTIEG